MRYWLVAVFLVFASRGALAADPLLLTADDRAYLDSLGPVTLSVDPDWEPYETISPGGTHEGIAADLVKLIAERSGVTLQLVVTKDWDESIASSQSGRSLVLSFLNQTRKREEWLVFTEPYFTDPNVFITREEHEYISDPARLTGETVALPSGTSIEERLRSEYPNLRVILTKSEPEAVRLVSERQADMTLRSLTMAAYTIKKEGLFNLKIAGQIPSFTNQFRLGVVKQQPRLRDLLNRGVATITPQEVQQAVNRHVSIRVQQGFDYWPFLWLALGFLVVACVAAVWINQLRHLNAQLAARDAEKAVILKEVHHRIKNNMAAVQAMLYLQAQELNGTPAAAALADAQSRLESMMLLYDKLYRSDTYGSLAVGPYLSDLVSHILENFARRAEVTYTTACDEVSLPSAQLQPLAILLNELITNAMKYAFAGRSSGKLAVELRRSGSGLKLSVADDGVGMATDVDFDHSTGFGMQLASLMAQQLRGKLHIERKNGTRVVLEFPAT
ncbi:MAG: transporter substrate-binding domain-containing protein [Spirochaetales bacterium]